MKPLSIEQLPQEKVLLYNEIIGKQRLASFTHEDKAYMFSFCPTHKDYTPNTVLRLKMSDYTVFLGLHQLPAPSFFGKKLQDITLEGLDEDTQPIILEILFEGFLDTIEKKLGTSISIEAWEKELPAQDSHESLFFTITLGDTAHPIYGHFALEFPALQFLATLLKGYSSQKSTHFNAISIPASLLIGCVELSLEESLDLSTNDIVFFTNPHFFESGQCKAFFANKLSCNAVLKGNTVTLSGIMENENPDKQKNPDKEKHPKPEKEEATRLGALPINLVFEVGNKQVPLSELQSLKEGFTFELDSPADSPVTIRANGEAVGKGTLLQVGDRVGVRVTKFQSHA